ncbi:TPA: ZinT/AdcA family metal-binding protein [Staphylococcus aureus]
MKKKLGMLLLVPAVTLSLAACGNDDGKDKDGKVTIKTTVYPLQSFAEQIGGKHVKVSSIYPAGTDLHSYEPTQKDILSASKSDLFMYTGDNLDPVAKKVASTIKDKDKKLSLEDKLDKAKLLTDQHEHGEEHEHEGHDHEKEEHHHHHGGYDPHVWLDPKINQTFAKEIKDELVKKDPKHKDDYEKNYKKLNDDLKKIDNDMKQVTKDKQGNAVFISHESIGYLADRYGFVQKGIQNMNAEDPSQKELTKIVKEIRDSNAKYILYEDNVANKVTETIRKETDAKPLKFYNMESLNKEQQKKDNITYQSLMKSNIENIGKALDSGVKVKDRELSDYAGEWQSVYPYLKDGTLDEVMEHKAENDPKKSAKDLKAYYDKGYKTDITNIDIKGNEITFTKDGKKHTGKYEYNGKKTLKYPKGNRGVRFMFKLVDGYDKDLPKFIQFSDHNIAPKKAEHFHIFMGNDNDALLKEMDNWPTYYPSKLNKDQIKEEMLAH